MAADEGALKEERVDPAGASLPACASPLMTAIWERTKGVIANGTVPGTSFVTANNVVAETPLIEGPQIFGAMADLIAGANREVDFQTYVYEADSDVSELLLSGLSRLEARLEASRPAEPVVVRMLLDVSSLGFGSKARYVPELGKAIEGLHLDPALVKVELAMFVHTVFGNLHVKTLVVDGERAILTGANPQKHHDAEVGPWFDTGYAATGGAATALLADFDFHWGHRKTKRWVCGGDRDGDDCKQPSEKLTRTFPASTTKECLPVLAATRSGDGSPFGNATDNPQDQAFLAAFANARTHVAMITPNINDDAFKKGLVDAIVANDALRVDLVLSKNFNDATVSLPGQGGNNQKNVDRLYESLARANVGAPCSRLRIRWYSEDGASPISGNGPHASHAKYASFDGQVAIVGSANMDTQSWNHSHEANIVVDSARVTKAWDDAVFAPAFARSIDVEQCAGD